MKKSLFFLSMILFPLLLTAQVLPGKWSGVLKMQGMELDLYFNITQKDTVFSATMDVPAQGATGIPVSAIVVKAGEIEMLIAALGASFTGTVQNDSLITGQFKQGAYLIPLDLTKSRGGQVEMKRPQTPKPPFSYRIEEVIFENKKDSVRLSGTLTLPAGKADFPTVVLISGSGPQDRNSEVFGHQPFWVLADYLTRQGVGVLRYDERGVGESTGKYSRSTSNDFASDVKAAVAYLRSRKEVNSDKIGLIGHSEGGIIAPMVAAADKKIAFIVSLAGPGLPGHELLLLQKAEIERASGVPEAGIAQGQEVFGGIYEMLLNQSPDASGLQDTVIQYLRDQFNNMLPEDQLHQISGQLTTPWMLNFLRHDPRPVLQQVDCRVLGLNGEKDLQVPAEQNLSAIETALKAGGNDKIRLTTFPGLNHLFQPCETGLIREYASIETSFSEEVMKTITDWILL